MGSTELVYALIAFLAVALLLLVGRRRGPAALPGAPDQKKVAGAGKTPGGDEARGEGTSGGSGNELETTQVSRQAKRGEQGPRTAAISTPDQAPGETQAPAKKAELPRGPTEIARSGGPEKAKAPTLDVGGLRRGLAKSRAPEGFFGKLKALLGGSKDLNASLAEDIEEALLSSDVGVKATEAILGRVRDTLSQSDLTDATKVWAALRQEARRILDRPGTALGLGAHPSPTVVLLVGVNGSGKTTTIGKLATRLAADGQAAVLAAGDTFRAAAVQQLVVWGERSKCEVVKGKEGGDPGSVIFDAIRRAKEKGAGFVLADTAGRLHTQTNLIQEIQKVVRSASKAMEGAPHELLLVIDATNGQNALAQAKQFREALPLTGIVLTKLDGTAKGGVVLGICDTLELPIRYIGIGERADDLREFSSDEFLEALLGKDTEASAA